MELDLVHAVPGSVVGVKHGRVGVGLAGPFTRLRAAREPPRGPHLFLGPAGSFSVQCFEQHGIVRRVGLTGRRNLIEHFMSCRHQ